MSDISQGPGWWQASDGKWYPPKERDDPPAQGWWLASDGKWYPPERKPATRGRTSGRAKSSTKRATTAKPTSATTPGTEPSPAKKAATPKPSSAKKSTTKKPAAKKPAAAKKTSPAPAPRSEKPASNDAPAPTPAPQVARARPNLLEGVNPLDQIRRRDQASQQDAQVLAPMRAAAASRALDSLRAQIEADKAEAATEARRESTFGGLSPKDAAAQPAPPAAERATSPAPRAPAAGDDRNKLAPLLEVKPSALSTDIEHIGERLAIFEDRVELRDRNDRVRQQITSDEITDVVVHRKLTGAVLSIESVTGPAIVARGLRPDQAEDARDLIMRKTRPTRPVDRSNRPAPAKGKDKATGPSTTEAPASKARTAPSRTKVDEADLLRKLGDLHRAGVLTDEEFEQKIELVGRLVRGENLSPSTT